MGRKIPKNDSLLDMEHIRDLHLSFYRESCDGPGRTSSWTKFSPDHGEGISCEFKDYCNRLYYIDGKCTCAMGWKRSTGLVLPLTA